MKKIFNIVLSATVLLALAPTLRAQLPYPEKGQWSIANQIYDKNKQGGIGDIDTYPLIFPREKGLHQPENADFAYSKDISSPLSDGTYWIKLESFATGAATYVESAAPADIVLVLDLSSSMVNNGIPYETPEGGWTYNNASQGGPYHYPYSSGWTSGYYEVQPYSSNGRYYLRFNTGGNNWRYLGADGTSHSTQPNNAPRDPNATIYPGNLYGETRLSALKRATKAFIEVINKNDKYEDDGVTERKDGRLGNRISIVTFNSTATPQVSLNAGGFADTSDETHKTVKEFQDIVDGFQNGTGTRQDLGIQTANGQLATIDAARRLVSSRTIVVFTDGEPYPTTVDGVSTYNRAISAALTSKTKDNPETTAVEGYDATVFTVGLFSSTPTSGSDLWKFMNLMSSNAPNATNMDTPGADYKPEPEGKFYKDASAANVDLTAVFTEIAHQSGGSSTSLSAASSNVDVVSNSFVLPDGADAEHIQDYVKIFIAKLENIQINQGKKKYNFYEEYLKGHTPDDYTYYELNEKGERISDQPKKVDATIGISFTAPNKIKVTGFDYSSNFCGPVYVEGWKPEEHTDEENLEHIDHYQGYKIIIMIPIKMNPDAVGGPDVKTNGPGSGIFISDQETTAFVAYESPEVSLPVNIHIKKKGLSKGESAKFIIEKAALPKEGPVDYSKLKWSYVSSVFVTKPENAADTDPDPVVYVRGLPANEDVTITTGEGDEATTTTEHQNLVYRISEEKWSWSYDPKTGPKYTNTDYIDNPFEFENEKKDNIDVIIRHAESKATNIFKPGVVEGNVKYDDSKKNDRTKPNSNSGS